MYGGSDDDDDDEAREEEDEDEGSEEDDNSTTLPSVGLLSKVRSLIRAIRASGQRQDALADIIVRGNTAGMWVDAQQHVISLDVKKLLLDVRTRWDSTFQMLVRLHELKQVCIFYSFASCANSCSKQPVALLCRTQGTHLAKVRKLELSNSDWEHIVEYIGVLQVYLPNKTGVHICLLMSSLLSTPTAFSI